MKVNKQQNNRLGCLLVDISYTFKHEPFTMGSCKRRVNEIEELPSLKLNDSKRKRVGMVKSLGVIVDEGLT